MKRVSVFGLGYVGSVTAACLAQMGNYVVGLDINPLKVDAINAGRSPIVEAEIGDIIAEVRRAGRLTATSDVNVALAQTDISFISVATPSQRNGKLDLRSIEKVSQEVGTVLRQKTSFHTFVIRSTVLPGTTERVVIPALEAASGKRADQDFAVCMNPEFMREATAVKDFFHPPFTVIGAGSPSHLQPLRELYDGIPGQVFETPLAVAEMVKYVCNAYHALKVCFANEIGTLCAEIGVDPGQVMRIFSSDTKLNISASYLMPGFAFGGSCLPKDVRALGYKAKELDLNLPLLQAVLPSNAEQIERAVQTVMRSGKRKVAMLGLSFKAGTDDLRESPSVQLVKRLLGEGFEIKIWDDQVSMGRLVGSNRQFIEEVIPHVGSLLCEDMRSVIDFGEVVLIGTRAVNRDAIAPYTRPDHTIIDLVQMQAEARVLAAIG
jgi:GDP-mannose 6-dehydrogenase